VIARLWRRRPADDVEAPTVDDPLSVPSRPTAAPRDALDIARSRLSIAGALFVVLFGVIALRMAHVSLLREAGEGGGPGTAVAGNTVRAERAEIVDRNGVIMATSLPVASLFVNPRQVIDVDEASRKLSSVLPEFKPDDIREKLESGKSWVWVKRALSPREQDAVNRLGLPGFEFQNQERRIFPQGAIAPHILGYTDVDNTGVAGIERTFDQRLRQGEKLTLSIDMRLQRFVEQELARAVQKFSAIGATAAVMEKHRRGPGAGFAAGLRPQQASHDIARGAVQPLDAWRL